MRPQLSIHYPSTSELWSIAPREDSISVGHIDGINGGSKRPHYSRQTIGADGFLVSGRCVVLSHRGPRGLATWGVVYGIFRDVWRWRNSVFSNTSGTLSSTLIEAATEVTYAEWIRKYLALPDVPLRTEVDIEATRGRRSKRHEPGHCYLEAGWTKVRDIPRSHGRSAKVELEAPR